MQPVRLGTCLIASHRLRASVYAIPKLEYIIRCRELLSVRCLHTLLVPLLSSSFGYAGRFDHAARCFDRSSLRPTARTWFLSQMELGSTCARVGWKRNSS